MRAYILDADANRYKNLHVSQVADWDRLEGFDATPRAATWSPVGVEHSPDEFDKPGGDYPNLHGVASACVFSARAVEVLGDLLDGRGELLPLTGDQGSFFLFNVTHFTEAFDEELSAYQRYSDGGVMGVERYVFDPQRLSEETIFKLRDLPGLYTYVTDAFVERVQEAGLTGFRFDRVVWESDG